MASEKWLTFEEAAELVRARLGTSVGRSEALARAAIASGEVRFYAMPVLLAADDGVVGMALRPGRAQNMGGVIPSKLFSKDDLLDWLERTHPKATLSSKSDKAPKPRKAVKDQRAKTAMKSLWPDGLPGELVLSNGVLCKSVAEWIKDDCKRHNVPPDVLSNDTILRAASRKK